MSAVRENAVGEIRVYAAVRQSVAVIRLVGSVLIEINDEWHARGCCFSQSLMRKWHEPLEMVDALPGPLWAALIHWEHGAWYPADAQLKHSENNTLQETYAASRMDRRGAGC